MKTCPIVRLKHGFISPKPQQAASGRRQSIPVCLLKNFAGWMMKTFKRSSIRRQAKYVLIRTGNRFTAFSNEKKSHFKCFSLSTKSRLKGKPTLTRHIADATTSGSRPTAFSVSKATHNACPAREWKSTLSVMTFPGLTPMERSTNRGSL